MSKMPSQVLSSKKLASTITAVIASGHATLLLYLVGRPIVTDDLWWSLTLGSRHAAAGAWLDEDPLLFTAAAGPDSAAWLAQTGLYLVGQAGGFPALRILHLAVVLCIAWAAWRLLRNSGLRGAGALVGVQLFTILAAYRLCQLRPHLASILFTLLFVDLLINDKSRRASALVISGTLCALWSNLHAGFILGPYLVLLALVGESVHGWFETSGQNRSIAERLTSIIPGQRLRMLVVVTLAGGLNPSGFTAYLRPFMAGRTTPDLSMVSDEWSAFAPFALPQAGHPPSLLVWMCYWLLLLGLASVASLWLARRGTAPPMREFTSFFIAVGLVPLSFVGIRFVWLGIIAAVPIGLACARIPLRPTTIRSEVFRWLPASTSALLLWGFVSIGDWPRLSQGTPLTVAGYQEPYAARKYHAHAIWFLADTATEGRAFTNYFESGFLGFWTPNGVKTFINGSLNVSRRAAVNYEEIVRSYPDGLTDETKAIFNDEKVDLFVGIGLPLHQSTTQPWRYTTSQLESDRDWVLVFRSARSSVYLRRVDRNAENLNRIAEYYSRANISFDRSSGFDVRDVLDSAPEWAFTRGLIPADYARLVRESVFQSGAPRERAGRRLSLVFAALGLYDRMIHLEEQRLAKNPDDPVALRRLVWALLRDGRLDEAQVQRARLESLEVSDAASRMIVEAARRTLSDGRSERIRSLPLLSRLEARELTRGYAAPAPRPWSEARRLDHPHDSRAAARPPPANRTRSIP